VAVDRAQIEEGETVLNWNPQGGVREEDLKDIEENSRGRDWESGKDLERCWSLGPKQDSLEALYS
jgi:hypothetical protein